MWKLLSVPIGMFALYWHLMHMPAHYVAARPVVLHRMVTVWSNKKAATMASIWGLTPDEVAKPVRIFK